MVTEVLDEQLPEIEILYIPTDTRVNIFSDEVLKDYYNDFLNSEYSALELVKLHNNILNEKLENFVYTLKDCYYRSFKDESLVKVFNLMNTYNYNQYQNTKRIHASPIQFQVKEYEYVDFGYVYFNNRHFYLDNTFPISGKQKRYMVSREETLWSRMSYTPEHVYDNIMDDLVIRSNNIDIIDNEMKRYGKSFYEMTEEQLDIIRNIKLNDKEHSTIYGSKISYKPIKTYHNDEMLIGNIDTSVNPMDFDKYGTLRNNYVNTRLMYYDDKSGKYSYNQMIQDIATNVVDVNEFKENMNAYLKLLRVEHVLEALVDMNKTAELYDSEKDNSTSLPIIVGDKDVLNKQYVNDNDFAEVLEGEQDDNMYNIYVVDVYDENVSAILSNTANTANINTSVYTDPFSYDEEMYEIIKANIGLIVELQELSGIPVDIVSVLDECVKSHEKDIFACFIVVWYLRLQESVYTYSFSDVDVYYNKHCVDVMVKDDVPIVIEGDNDSKRIEISEKNLLQYLLCCVELMTNKQVEMLNRIGNIIRKHDSFKTQLDDLHVMYDGYKSGIVNKNNMYLNMIKNLKEDMKKNSDTVHEKFVKSLLYIPTILNRVNTYKMGCCKQLLSVNFTSFTDISKVDGKNVLRYVKRYMEEFNKNKQGNWNTISYPSYVEYEHMMDIIDTDYNVDEECEKIDLYKALEPLVELGFPLDVFKKNKNSEDMTKFVKETAKNFIFFAGVKDKGFNDFILSGCLDSLNVRRVLYVISPYIDSIYTDVINGILRECCGDKDYIERSKYALRYITCMMLSVINDVDIANTIYNNISKYDTEVMNRETYNKAINNIREKYKLHVINILESKDKQEKDLLIDLKKYGVYDYTLEDNSNDINNINNDDLKNDYNYGGDDNNDVDLRD